VDVSVGRRLCQPVLAIDDIHFLANKNAMQEEFLHTFNTIDLAGKQVILASDAHPKEIGKLCEKLVNRFVSEGWWCGWMPRILRHDAEFAPSERQA
jgi:hypothetical protein